MRDESYRIKIIIDNKVPQIGSTYKMSEEKENGEIEKKSYRVDKYISSEISEDGKQIELWLEVTEC